MSKAQATSTLSIGSGYDAVALRGFQRDRASGPAEAAALMLRAGRTGRTGDHALRRRVPIAEGNRLAPAADGKA
jgi:hypothetical protein